MAASNPITIQGIDHVVLRADDHERLIAFYCNVLNCTLEREQTQLGLYQLRAGAALIDIVDARGELGLKGGGLPDHSAPNMDHLCLLIEPWDADAIISHLARHNVRAGEPVTRYGAGGHGPSIYLNDPEGNSVELKGPSSSRSSVD